MNRSFLSQYGAEIGTLTVEHLWLTGFAMLFAAALAIPAGVWLTRSPRWAKPVHDYYGSRASWYMGAGVP